MNTTNPQRLNGAASRLHQAPGGASIDTRLHRVAQVVRAPLSDDEHADRLERDAQAHRLAVCSAHARADARLFVLVVIVAIAITVDLVLPWLPGVAR